jgi:hypothetical protein
MSRSKNLKFSEGETWVIDATFLDADGEALDLTGATVEWVVALRPGQAAIVTATTGNGLISVDADPTTGLATITVPYASHSAATPKGYQHEARVTLASGEVTVQFRGMLTVDDSLYVV